MHPLTMAMVKPMNRLERVTCTRKVHSESEKRAKKVPLAARDGRSIRGNPWSASLFSRNPGALILSHSYHKNRNETHVVKDSQL